MQVKTIGFKEFENAIKRNPQMVLARGRVFLNSGLQAYRAVIDNDPWRVGSAGGGVPVSSGVLKRSHKYTIRGLRGTVRFDEDPTGENEDSPYGRYVHEGTPRGQMKARPWLDHAKNKADEKIQSYYRTFLEEITSDLAK